MYFLFFSHFYEYATPSTTCTVYKHSTARSMMLIVS